MQVLNGVNGKLIELKRSKWGIFRHAMFDHRRVADITLAGFIGEHTVAPQHVITIKALQTKPRTNAVWYSNYM